MAGYIILFIYLFLMAPYDMKRREISLPASAAASLALLAVRLCFAEGGEVTIGSFSGVLVGGSLVAISVLSRGEIGIGDGILFVVSGFVFGLYENVLLLFLSLLASAVAGVFLLAVRRVGRKYALPFAPFVLFGYGVICLWKVFG